MAKKISDKELKRLLYPDGRAKDIYRKVSYPLVKAILPLNIHPDIIHLFRLIYCLAGTALFFTGDYILFIIGALLFQMNILFDTFDGALARYQNLASVKGEYQDVALDHLTSSFLYFLAAAGLGYTLTDNTAYLWIGLATIVLAQIAAFLRAMYIEYNIDVRKAQQNSTLVRLAHQDNSRLFALMLLIAAILALPQLATLFFILVVAKVLILSIHILGVSGKNPLNPLVFIRYILLIFVIILSLTEKIVGINSKKLRKRISQSKHRSVIEKQIAGRLE